MRIALGCDHAGFRLKCVVIDHLHAKGHEVHDMGTHSEEPVDYPVFCAAAGRAVVDGAADAGIVIGGSGQGEQIAANKVNGVRAALCHDVEDLGTDSEQPVGYPPFCADAARKAVNDEADLAIVLGGSGQGEQIAANKVHGVRAALCHDLTTARLARSHNDANVLSLGARLLGETLALEIVDEFLAGSFEGGRHVARVEQLRAIEDDQAARTSG